MLIYLQAIETPSERARFQEMYLTYRGLMYRVAYQILKNRQDAEDAVHQSFVKLAEQAGRLPDGPGPRMQSLAVTVAERKAIDLWRSRRRHPQVELDEVALACRSAPLPDSALAAALADLPPRYREALLLKYCNGYSHREIAGFLSSTPEAVSQVIRRAKKRLAKALEEGEDAL